MGAIDRFDIKKIKEDYNFTDYVETGTGIGGCLDYVMQFNFERYFSVEIHPEIFNSAIKKYESFNNVYLINDNSEYALKNILPQLSKPVLFWLDAHFPGADFGYAAYDTEKNKDLRIPLEKEIEILSSFKFIKDSVLIIDDLRIYEDGPFGAGNWDQRSLLGSNNIDFLNIFKTSHSIEKDYRDHGYIIIKPI
jgi:hypothetical protein